MPRVTELYAWVVADTDEDDEGVPAFFDVLTGGYLPMIGADMARAESLREQAQLAADSMGKPVTLRRSVGPLEDVEVLYPRTV